MNGSWLVLFVTVPAVAGVAALFVRKQGRPICEALALVATVANLVLAILLFGRELTYSVAWAGPAYEFSFRFYSFSGFILLAVSGFSLLVSLYSVKFMRGKPYLNQYYSYLLISLAMVNGAVLSDNLLLMLFFWEGLLLTLFGMIAIGRPGAWKTATKAFIIVGISDLCLTLGIALTYYAAGTLTISTIATKPLPLDAVGCLAMIFLMIGAVSKAGSLPFHTWIPDAAVDAPLPFMAFLPASLEKLLGIYFLTRISLDMFALTPESWISMLMMILGALTILVAVMMALVQTDYKRLLAYHAISQVGYMILGIGTAVPIGIIGGLFHMINNALYKSCLFLTAGSVEKQAGTTDLRKLGGLARNMPVTFTCFFIAAVSISGVPPFNGFFSKELVYDGALQRGIIFYLAAVIGTVLTAASFLKLGHAAFLGKRDPSNDHVREAPPSMLVPMIVIAASCVVFGLWNALPLRALVQPAVSSAIGNEDFSGLLPHNWMLAGLACLAIVLALVNHLFGVRRTGRGIDAVEHIHHAPVLGKTYDLAAKRCFDPYDIGLRLVDALSWTLWAADRIVDWVYDTLVVGITLGISKGIRLVHTGSYSLYVLWALIGVGAILAFVLMQ